DEKDGVVRIASSRLFDVTGLNVLRLQSGCDFTVVLATSAEIERSLKETLGVGADTVQSLVSDAEASGDGVQVVSGEEEGEADLSHQAQDASIVRFVNQVLTEAIDLRATDVHFEPFENRFRVRYRVDGVLVEASIPAEVRRFQAAIVSRLKILSHLDIAEKRLPQDGRIKLKVAGREVDVRVSIIPMLHGEAVVLRLLDRSAPLLGLERLGMSARDRTVIQKRWSCPTASCW
ncbi:MAG: Flp pilus assembly complex ATPase component TadA, partial [Phycisphaerales bacterium]|nr:Flp pilus assembly complex ATPase component TadA [Phycisphaerales bacterium]